MSAHHGRKLGFPDLLSFDMGGTTTKGALVRGFTALKHYDLEVGRVAVTSVPPGGPDANVVYACGASEFALDELAS